MRFLVLWLLSGCALVGAGRVSTGLLATTDGAVGVAVAGELGGGFVMSTPFDRKADGEMLGLSVGTNATTRDLELEIGERIDYVHLSRRGELRLGARAGAVVGRDGDPQLAAELAATLTPASQMHGYEVRGGPVLGIHDDDVSFDGVRVFVGIVVQHLVIGARHDPFEGLGKH